MKKWKVLIPLGMAAAGAAATLLLMRKPGETGGKPAAARPAGEKKAEPPKNLKEGSYSFISGFKDPATVETTITYDPEKFSFAVISEEYLNPSSDSHVAVLWGEDYHLQLEYAAYYPGEDFELMSKAIAEKFKGFAPASYGANACVRYLDGDSYGVRMRIPGDEQSYLLITVIRAAADPDDFAALPEDPDFRALLAGVRIAVKR